MRRLIPATVLLVALSTLVGCGGGGGDDDVRDTPREVGAAFVKPGDGRVVLISRTGDRFVYYDANLGTFTQAEPISVLFPNMPFATDGSAAHTPADPDNDTRLADTVGSEALPYSSSTGSAGAPVSWTSLGGPFEQTSAMFATSDSLFLFNPGGTKYTAYSLSNDSWSPVYEFLGDFGGGGAPISAVGAAYFTGTGNYILFDQSGTRWAVYSGGGTFSRVFTLDELGDGTLSFN